MKNKDVETYFFYALKVSRLSFFSMTLILLLSPFSEAQTHLQEQPASYYSFSDNQLASQNQQAQVDFQDLLVEFYQQSKEWIKLTSWVSHFDQKPEPSEPYSRKNHFGSWVKDRRDGRCLNIRARVLERESTEPVQFKETSPCTIESGKWYDPYLNQWVYRASSLQVDHMVPLKHAYTTGAFNWSRQKKCLYANFMGQDTHLIPVSGIENGRKGDRSPDRYMPINQQYWCTYLKNWLQIKLVWNLFIQPEEAMGIQDAMEMAHCSDQDFSLTTLEIQKIRAKMVDSGHPCTRYQ